MTNKTEFCAQDILPTILNLLVKQQRLSENTSSLVESMVMDVGKFRDYSERIAIMSNKIESIERMSAEAERRRIECIQHVTEQFRQAEIKREGNKDRIIAVEARVRSDMSQLRHEINEQLREQEKGLLEKMEERHDEARDEITGIREKIAYSAGKYGAVVSGLVSVGMMLLRWLIGQHGPMLK